MLITTVSLKFIVIHGPFTLTPKRSCYHGNRYLFDYSGSCIRPSCIFMLWFSIECDLNAMHSICAPWFIVWPCGLQKRMVFAPVICITEAAAAQMYMDAAKKNSTTDPLPNQRDQ